MCPERDWLRFHYTRKARQGQGGFVLASAIFLLVIMAALGVFIVQVSVGSHTTSALDVQGARAYQAARLGVEAGLFSVRVGNNCPATATTINNIPGLNGFTVVWNCAATPFVEPDGNRTIWQITSTASYGALASPDYVERQLVVVTER